MAARVGAQLGIARLALALAFSVLCLASAGPRAALAGKSPVPRASLVEFAPQSIAYNSSTNFRSLAQQLSMAQKLAEDDEDDEDDEDEEDDIPPLKMTAFDKVFLQAGWIIVSVGIVFGMILLQALYHWPNPGADEIAGNDRGRLASGYRILWGKSPWSRPLDVVIVLVCMLNFYLFAMESEQRFTGGRTDLVWQFNWWTQIFTVCFFGLVIAARIVCSQAHPGYGGCGGVTHLLRSIYLHLDIVALIPSIIDIVTGKDQMINMTWLSLARLLEREQRKQDSGKALRNITGMLREESPLITTMLVFALVVWIFFSGLYFIANYDSTTLRWEAVEYEDAAGDWQAWDRFESVPSSLFFVLINLSKENPLAEFHTEPISRIFVMLVCFIGVPIFALPAGVLGFVLRRHAASQFEDEPPIPAIEMPDLQSQARELRRQSLPLPRSSPEGTGSTPGPQHWWQEPTAAPWMQALLSPQPVTQPSERSFEALIRTILICVIGSLSFGSVIVYFFYTAHVAGDSTILWITFAVDATMLVVVDATVGVIFAFEWALRFGWSGTKFLFTMQTWVDFFSWAIAMAHVLVFFVLPTQNGLLDFLRAACVIRVFRLERYLHAFAHMYDVVATNWYLLRATGVITFLCLIFTTAALYAIERDSTDGDIRENYGSAKRALWAEIINLHGEWVWCDYSAVGKGICALLALFSIGIFMVPIAVFADEYQDKFAEDMGDTEPTPPWQAWLDPEVPGFRRHLYMILYAHLHEPSCEQEDVSRRSSVRAERRTSRVSMVITRGRATTTTTTTWGRSSVAWGTGAASPAVTGLTTGVEGRMRARARVFGFVSLLLTTTSALVTIFLTLKRFHPDECKDSACHISSAFYYFDLLSIGFFMLELVMRLVALGPYYLCSIVGLSDVISLVAIGMTTLSGGFRKAAIWPTYGGNTYVDDAMVPLRLLRTFCYENYVHPISILTNVVKQSWEPLYRSGYSLVAVWYFYGTILYLCERDDEAAKEADAKGEDEPEMSQRYRDVLSGLQYTLVHITGDYPISEYGEVAQVFHVFGIIFGMAVIASFTGIFVAGFKEYLRPSRDLERREAAERDLLSCITAVLTIQSRFRIRRARRVAAGQSLQIPSREREKFRIRSALQSIVLRRTPVGKCVMGICHFSLLLNLLVAMALTMPEVEQQEAVRAVCGVVDIATGTVFILEYVMRLLGKNSAWREAQKTIRIIDFVCLLPVFYSLVTMQPHVWRKEQKSWFDHVVDVAVVLRVLRVLDFPVVRKMGKKAWHACTASAGCMVVPIVFALSIWVTSTSVFMWAENCFGGPDAENQATLPDALYWTSIYIIGEWANVDFSPGAGSRMCIFYCLFGVAMFALPTGLLMEGVESALVAAADKNRDLRRLMSNLSSTNKQTSLPQAPSTDSVGS